MIQKMFLLAFGTVENGDNAEHYKLKSVILSVYPCDTREFATVTIQTLTNE